MNWRAPVICDSSSYRLPVSKAPEMTNESIYVAAVFIAIIASNTKKLWGWVSDSIVFPHSLLEFWGLGARLGVRFLVRGGRLLVAQGCLGRNFLRRDFS